MVHLPVKRIERRMTQTSNEIGSRLKRCERPNATEEVIG